MVTIKPFQAQLLNCLSIKSKTVRAVFCSAVLCVLLTSCAQISSLQTAKPLLEDEQIVGFSATAYATNDAFFSGELGLSAIPHLEIFGRQGFAPKFDAGLKISSSANIAIDAKYQFLGNAHSKLAMATGLSLEYQFVPKFETFVSRQTIPLYVSYHPNNNFAIYTVPKLIHQYVSRDDNIFFIGSNLGIQKRLTKRFSMVAEGSVFGNFDQRFKFSEDILYQGGLGFIFDL